MYFVVHVDVAAEAWGARIWRSGLFRFESHEVRAGNERTRDMGEGSGREGCIPIGTVSTRKTDCQSHRLSVGGCASASASAGKGTDYKRHLRPDGKVPVTAPDQTRICLALTRPLTRNWCLVA